MIDAVLKIDTVTIHLKDASDLAEFSVLLPDCDAELTLDDAFSLDAQRKRLLDIYRPSLSKIIVFKRGEIVFGTFVKRYANNNEGRKISNMINSVLLSDSTLLQSETKSQEERRNENREYMKKRRQDAELRSLENSARKKRRKDPLVREQENAATRENKRLRRTDPEIRTQENQTRTLRRKEPLVREQENAATRENKRLRRMNPEIRAQENQTRTLRREDPLVREKENAATRTNKRLRRTDPEIRAQENQTRTLRREDPLVREKENAATRTNKRLRRTDPEIRAQENQTRTLRREDPLVREKENAATRKNKRLRRTDPEIREQENHKRNQRRADSSVKEAENTSRKTRRENAEVRRKENDQRQKRRDAEDIREHENSLKRVRYSWTPLERAKRWVLNIFRKPRKTTSIMSNYTERPEEIRKSPVQAIPSRSTNTRRNLFPALISTNPGQLNRRVAQMTRKARISILAKKITLRKKAKLMERTLKSKRNPRTASGTDLGSRDAERARKAQFLRKLCRPVNAAYSPSLRLPSYSSFPDNGNTLLKIIVAQLVLRPKNMLTKEFVKSIIDESRDVYDEGCSMLEKLTTKLRKEQKYLQYAMEHKNPNLTEEQVIGGLRIHVKTCDPQPRKHYVPLERLFQTPGEIPGLTPPQPVVPSEPSDEFVVTNLLEHIVDTVVQELDHEETEERRDTEGREDIILDAIDNAEENVADHVDGNDAEVVANKDLKTYAALCDSSCILPACEWSSIIPLKLRKICDIGKSARILLQEISAITYCEKCEANECQTVSLCDNIKKLLSELAPHCQNVRTIVRRFYEVRRLSSWIFKWEKAVLTSDLAALYDLVKQQGYLKELPVMASGCNFQTEDYATRKFYKLMEKCRQKMANHEIHACFSCTILYSKDKIKKISSTSDIALPITKGLRAVPDDIMICSNCRDSLRKGRVPVLFTGNGLEIPFLPGELQDLNWLETLLIRKVRPIMATFLLGPLRGPGGNQMRGFKGSVLHLPVEIENSINHVIKHLPSAEGLDIIVNTAPKSVVQKLLKVDMEKVVRALLWLKENNEHYRDININATYNPVTELINCALDGDPNLQATQRTPACSADGNLEVEAELEQLRLLPQSDCQNDGEHLLTLVTEHLALTNIDPPNPDPIASKKLFEMNNMQGDAINVLEQDLDVKVFPELFPTGKFGMHYTRGTPVSETLFLRRNLRSRFSQFRRNLTYIFFNANRKDIKTIIGSASIMVKKLSGGNSIFDRIARKDSSIDDLLTTMFTNVRSHQEYWANVKRELRTKITYFGPPTFFVTLNPAEYEWTELREYYKALYPHMKKTISEFVAMDPLIFARHFTRRERRDIWRGSPSLLAPGIPTPWSSSRAYAGLGERRPQIGRDPDEDVAVFIDQHISCSKRDPAKEPTLAELVNRFQQHRQPCSETCAIIHRVGRKKIKSCRFMFPIEPSKETVILSESERKNLSSSLRMKKGYLLKRADNENFTNAYNCALLMIWRGNVDIQMVSNKSLKYVDYVTSYVGKGESKAILDTIDLTRSKCNIKDLVGFAIKFMKNREMGAAEAADRCLGHKLHHSDTDVLWLHTNCKEERMRRLKTTKEMENTEEGGSETADNFLDVYYPRRSTFLENFSLFNIFMNYKTVSKLPGNVKECKVPVSEICQTSANTLSLDGWETSNISSPFYQHPANLAYRIEGTSKWLISRTKPILPRMYWPNFDDGPEEQECWCRRVLLVFKPWRDEEGLMGTSKSYFDEYHAFISNSPEVAATGINRLLNASEELHAALMEKKKDYDEIAKIRKELGISEVEALEIQDIITSAEQVEAGEQRLNSGQKYIYDKIMKAVESENLSRMDGTLPHTPICMLVSGVGGTGKTALIHQLSAKITLEYSIDNRRKEEPAVILGAPTGLAALAIRGNTLHSLLQLGTDNAAGLNNAKQSELAVLFRNCRLLIVDEISMVSNTMLFKMCLRLTEIKNSTKAFGGLNVVVFGDLLQLPPVRARDVFERLSTKEVKRIFHSVPLNYPLWEIFEYGELTQNMRQAEDLEFSELLGRVRIGSPTEQDIRILLSRMITTSFESETRNENHAPRRATMEEAAHFYVEKWKAKEEIVALFSKVESVTIFNETVHKLLELEVEEIRAVDSIHQRAARKKGQRIRPYQRVGFRRKDWGRSKSSIDKMLKGKRKQGFVEGVQAGLPDILRVAVNSRVMLRRNIDVSTGLVNGAMGTVKEIVTDHKDRIINIMVKFDNIDEIIGIEKLSVPFDVNGELFATRTQFPLLVAYAVTIHKSQGMTANHVLANIEDAFAKGMSYVALSRARSIKGIHLIGFHPNKISASVSALMEYNRLRAKINLDPLPEGNQLPQLRLNFHTGNQRKKTSDRFTSLEDSAGVARESFRKKGVSKSRKNQKKLTEHGNDQNTLTVQKKNNTSKKRQRQTLQQFLVNESHRFKWLMNRGSDCFVNSVVWSILHSSLEMQISLGDDENAICSFFAKLRTNDLEIKHSTAELRDLFPQYAEGDHAQHDAVDFYRDLVANLPETLKKKMTLRKSVTAVCTACHEMSREEITYEAALLCMYNTSFSDIIEQLTEHHFVIEPCPICGEQTQHMVSTDFDAFCTNVIALEFGWADEDVQVFNRPDTVEMFDGEWKLVAAVEYLRGGRHGSCGHYVTWVYQSGVWYILDDQKQKEEHKETFKNDHSGIKMLLFKQIF